MRSKRIIKYRNKYKKGIIAVQILIILYAALFSISQLTSNTSAFFNHSSAVNFSIPTGSWWDGSDLLFIGKGNQNLNDACPPVEFSVEIKNNGYSMIDPTNYEIFYIENGNPKNGEKISEGTLEAMQAGEITTISYQAEEEGFYVVKAYQHPDYEGEAEKVIWSEKIKVKCPEKDKKNEKEKQADQVESIEDKDIDNESNEEDLEEPAESEETKETPEKNSDEQNEQQSSNETEEKPDKSAEQSNSEKETTDPKQEDKQASSSEKERPDKPKQAVTNKIEKEKPVDAEEQENSQVEKEGEQE
ncbi:amyloid fiber anchoring/assembly protein TapA [Gracilibacillus lacisalsi]|uniref:amyloid fiber anchoring/assembly protein TapA n=1 Tax=Gracilibacillus lacisalsi TaxID=393087 RepID=UPI00036A30BE|nr:amyloid fiber anchoring/assembly protein TapA [Gracilibacillus lacisalsi]